MSTLVALDTETTGLDPDTEDVFEIATVDIREGYEQIWRIEPRSLVVRSMHPKAAEVNQYHYRTSVAGWAWDEPGPALGELYRWLDGAHIVGAVPDFDTRHLTSLYRRFKYEPPRWHYHLIDIEAMAVGYIHGRYAWTPELPWRSDDLSLVCGVEPPTEDERHTALGDARWVARWYRALTGTP